MSPTGKSFCFVSFVRARGLVAQWNSIAKVLAVTRVFLVRVPPGLIMKNRMSRKDFKKSVLSWFHLEML